MNSKSKNLQEKTCLEFISNRERPKYIFGINDYAISVAQSVRIDGYIDEFTADDTFMGKPVIHDIKFIPSNAIVLSVVLCSPKQVINKLKRIEVDQIDYFTFLKYSGLQVKKIDSWDGFNDHYYSNREDYLRIFSLLSDDVSTDTFQRIVNFRLSYDLEYMNVFSNIQHKQYFEDFLKLLHFREVFVDVGGYDGNTSVEFIKRCPGYKKIFIFEPALNILEIAKNNLSYYENVIFHPVGLAERKQILQFDDSMGSSSKISVDGSLTVQVDALDNLVRERVTYIKMDIEGSENKAIEGAKNTILKYHPRLALCVYHKSNDLLEIPKQVLSIRNDYKIYLRHYTEGIDETVMYFVPDK